jgi:hypothetical protein
MMRKLFDFKCSNGHCTEHLVEDSVTSIRCACGVESTRMISPVKTVLDHISGDFPGATMKWARHREQKIQQERKTNS